jgi:hypothetical protein
MLYWHKSTNPDAAVGRGASKSFTPDREAAVSKVMPRRKPGQLLQEAPVCITLELLSRLSSVSLAKASTLLGISSTAMKKACRQLGVTRWPHGATPEAAGATMNKKMPK